MAGVKVSDSSDSQQSISQKLGYDAVVLAVGHSARDTYEMLLSHNVNLVQKDFAVSYSFQYLIFESFICFCPFLVYQNIVLCHISYCPLNCLIKHGPISGGYDINSGLGSLCTKTGLLESVIILSH